MLTGSNAWPDQLLFFFCTAVATTRDSIQLPSWIYLIDPRNFFHNFSTGAGRRWVGKSGRTVIFKWYIWFPNIVALSDSLLILCPIKFAACLIISSFCFLSSCCRLSHFSTSSTHTALFPDLDEWRPVFLQRMLVRVPALNRTVLQSPVLLQIVNQSSSCLVPPEKF